MSLESELKELRTISAEAKELLTVATDLASRGKKLNVAQKDQFRKFAERLDEAARKASRLKRKAQIAQLTSIINAHKLSLSVKGLPKVARDAIEADLVVQRSSRSRLNGKEATDFGGILKKGEQDEIAELAKKARDEADQKRFAFHFLDSMTKISDLAMTLAGKLAL